MDMSLTTEQILIDEIITADKREKGVDSSDDRYFMQFVLNQIFKEYFLDDDEINSGIVDGGGDGGMLDGFQRTRGVLRFMAAVIHELYITNDGEAMIMPGSIAFGKTQIREELIRYLSPGWDVIIENEVDGRRAVPATQDSRGSFYGRCFAHSRIARTVLLGSATGTRDQRVYTGILSPR